jgi:hypothetical protein
MSKYKSGVIAISSLFLAVGALSMPTSVAAETPAESASGYDVAKITNPVSCERMTVDSEAFVQLVKGIAASSDAADLEADYPGITRYMVVAMLPLLNQSTEETMPELWTKLGGVFDVEFTPSELYWMMRLFESGSGQKLLSSMCANAQIGGIIDDVMSDDMMIKVETVNKAMDETKAIAVKQTIEDMTKAEAREMMALAPKAGFQKFASIRPKLVEIKTAWMNEDDPRYDSQLDKVITDAIDEFTAATDEGRSPKKLPAEI